MGVQTSLASRALAHQSGHRVRRGGGRRLVLLDRRRTDVAGTLSASRPRLRAILAAGRRRAVSAHDPPGSKRCESDDHRHLVCRLLLEKKKSMMATTIAESR